MHSMTSIFHYTIIYMQKTHFLKQGHFTQTVPRVGLGLLGAHDCVLVAD